MKGTLKGTPIRFTPLGEDDHQTEFAKRLATLLCQQGVADILALPVATSVLAGIQKALDANEFQAGIDQWDRERQQYLEWLPRRRKAKRLLKKEEGQKVRTSDRKETA